MTQHVVIYTKSWCGYCRAAKQVLDQLEWPYDEIDVDQNQTDYDEMLALSEGRTSVPQIFIQGKGIGGYTELCQLIRQMQQAEQKIV